jgi:hypothetical protein
MLANDLNGEMKRPATEPIAHMPPDRVAAGHFFTGK